MEADKSYAVAHYSAMAQQAARLTGHDCPFTRAHEAFMERLRTGIDWPMPVNPQAKYPISEFLNEADHIGRLLLFAACHEASDGSDGKAAEQLRAFVAHVAAEYAATYEDMWEDA